MGRKRGGGFGSGLTSGIMAGLSLGKALRENMDKADLAEAMQGATTENKTVMSEENAPSPETHTYDSDTGQYVPSLNAIQSGVSDTIQEQSPEFSSTTQKVDRQFSSPQEKRTAMVQAGIDHLMSRGDPERANDLRTRALATEGAERKRSDDDQLRAVLSAGLPTSMRQGNGEVPASPGGRESAGGQQQGGRSPEPSYDDYMKRVAPAAMKALVQQGKLEEAKHFSDFVESEDGKRYATRWVAGVRKHTIGDSVGALGEFEKLYNDQLYNDGHTVKLNPMEGGKSYRIDQIDNAGNVIGSKTGATADLANEAAAALSPIAAVRFHTQQQGARLKETAQLQRDELRDDRRDDRLAARLNADADKRASSGGLTAAQQRGNAEIDAARETVSGLSPQDIQRRTAKTTNTGRENPDFDPGLERAARLAGRRKIGDDEVFDGRQGQQQKAATPTVDLVRMLPRASVVISR
jgi:hypothetical protein